MRFFIPGADTPELEQSLYAGIKQHVGSHQGAVFSDRRVSSLLFCYKGKEHEAKVGERATFNNELVIAILYEPDRNLYHVCTPNRGVLRNISILVGEREAAGVIDFDTDRSRVDQ